MIDALLRQIKYPASVFLGVGILLAGAMQTQFSGITKWGDLLVMLVLVVMMRFKCHSEGREIETRHREYLERKQQREDSALSVH